MYCFKWCFINFLKDSKFTQNLLKVFLKLFYYCKIFVKDRLFIEERNCLTYKPPPFSIFNASAPEFQASFDEYQERLKLIDEDLIWLLNLPYQKFWCQMIYDETCKKLVDSYLKMAPRFSKVLNIFTSDR